MSSSCNSGCNPIGKFIIIGSLIVLLFVLIFMFINVKNNLNKTRSDLQKKIFKVENN